MIPPSPDSPPTPPPPAPRVPFVIGVTGNVDPDGYHDDRATCEKSPEMIRLKERIWAILDWVRAVETPCSPKCKKCLGHDSSLKDAWLDPEKGDFVKGEAPPEDAPGPNGWLGSYHSCWKPLGLSHSPILVLSSLAPGIDTIVVEAALHYAAKLKALGQSPDIRILAPLPFPVGQYEKATTFDTDAKKKRFHQLLDAVGRENVFHLKLDNDHSNDTELEAERDLEGHDSVLRGKRSHLRYRAAGEYIAAHSDLLFAAYDVELDSDSDPEGDAAKLADLFKAGSSTIVAAKRIGLTYELIATSNNFTWADNGPVLRQPLIRMRNPAAKKETRVSGPFTGPLEFLHPYDTKPALEIPHRRRSGKVGVLLERIKGLVHRLPWLKPPGTPSAAEEAAEWQRAGDRRFRRVLWRQEAFNRLPETARGKEDLEVDKLTGSLLEADPVAAAFARRFDALARIRRRAGAASEAIGATRVRLLKQLILLIWIAAASFGAFEHWHHKGEHHEEGHLGSGQHEDGHHKAEPEVQAFRSPAPRFPEDRHSWIQCGLLVLSLSCIICSAWFYNRYRHTDQEENRYDYRAIGEALRVQFYWNLTGTGRSVAADYMQRQRDELDWIRYVVSSVAMPLEEHQRRFRGFDVPTRALLFECAHKCWVGAGAAPAASTQWGYFKKNAPSREHEAHFWHSLGWTFAVAGLISMVGMLVAEFQPRLAEHLEDHYADPAGKGLLLGMLLLLAPVFLPARMRPGHAAGAAPRGGRRRNPLLAFLCWTFGDLRRWGGGLAIASLILLASFFLGGITTIWPDPHNWWIILTGVVLLCGGLSVAWVERNFYTEEGRQYRAMGNLFGCASRRLEVLIKLYRTTPPESPMSGRLCREIQDLFYQLGCEALDENAEWLIQHRARPLEPFMAG